MSPEADKPAGGSSSEGQARLDALRQRLDALQSSVERLGTEGSSTAAGPDPGARPPSPTEPQGAPGTADPYAPVPPPPPQAPADPYAPTPPPAHADPYAAPYPPPPVPEPSPEIAYAPPPVPEPSPEVAYAPAASNGHRYEPPVPGNVAVVNVGPFADLIELRHFEEAVVALAGVNEVHVRRFGHGWAEVEIGIAGPHLLADELQRLGRPLRIEPGAEGELIVVFTDVEIEPVADAQRSAAADSAAAEPRSPAAEARSPAAEGTEAEEPEGSSEEDGQS